MATNKTKKAVTKKTPTPTPINKVAPANKVKPKAKLVTQYVTLEAMGCNFSTKVKKTKKNPEGIQTCKKHGTFLKNMYVEDKTQPFSHGHYLGYVAFCEAHKKEVQKRDIDAGVRFTEV